MLRDRLAVAVAVVCMVGCVEGATSPSSSITANAVPFYPLSGAHWSPTLYREWWANMEQCSGRTGNLDSVRWFLPADTMATWFWSSSNRPAGGTYIESERAIIVIRTSVTNQWRIEHEMLHAILRSPGHPSVFTDCGVA